MPVSWPRCRANGRVAGRPGSWTLRLRARRRKPCNYFAPCAKLWHTMSVTGQGWIIHGVSSRILYNTYFYLLLVLYRRIILPSRAVGSGAGLVLGRPAVRGDSSLVRPRPRARPLRARTASLHARDEDGGVGVNVRRSGVARRRPGAHPSSSASSASSSSTPAFSARR